MLKTGIKSIQLEDYKEVKEAYDQMMWFNHEFRHQVPNARIDSYGYPGALGHPHKMWEWSRALHLIKQMYPNAKRPDGWAPRVVSIGSAFCPLEPALCYLGYSVVDGDVDASCGTEREKINSFLEKFNGNPLKWVQTGFGTLHERVGLNWDVVMCISTIEHVDIPLEKAAWKEMADMLKPGGLLIVTMDGMPESRKGFKYDDVRWTNYGPDLIKARVEELHYYGMKPVGEVDYTYHGNHVNDYSFWFIAMTKGE